MSVPIEREPEPCAAPDGSLIFHNCPDRSYAEKVARDVRQKFNVTVGLCSSRILLIYKLTEDSTGDIHAKDIVFTEQNPEFSGFGFFVAKADETTASQIYAFVSQRRYKCKSYFTKTTTTETRAKA